MPEKTILSIIDDKKKVSIDILFLFVFGAILVLFGASSGTIGILGKVFSLPIKDEFRWMIILMGFLFILTGVFLTTKGQRGGTSEDRGKISIPPLYTFHGLKPELRCQPVFQNFRIDRSGETNRNAVYYMWADTYVKNTIHASIENNNNDGFFLRVKFNNNNDQDRWFSNISIHPILEQAINNQSDKESELIYRFLKIAARVQKSDSEDLEKISVIVRICDKNLTYWEYATVPGQFKQLPIELGDWQHKSVDLSSNIQWQKFKSDGNRENPSNVPDFSVVSGVTLVFGGYNNRGQIPMPGKGIIDIHEVYLDNNP